MNMRGVGIRNVRRSRVQRGESVQEVRIVVIVPSSTESASQHRERHPR